jgi:hypothetical protein
MVTPVETTTAGWPGSKPAANGHLLGAVMGSEVRVQGLDGIAEVLFDPPESQPSNTHSSEEQSRDELEFVTAMTAVPIVEPVHHFAPYSVWIVSRAELGADGFAVARASQVSTERRDDNQPVMIRAHVGTETSRRAPTSRSASGHAGMTSRSDPPLPHPVERQEEDR